MFSSNSLEGVLRNTNLKCSFVLANVDARAIAIPIGETILINALLREVPRRTNVVSAQDVIAAGATNLHTLTNDDVVLCAIQAAYAKAVTSTLYLAVTAACVCLPFAIFMEWKSVKPRSAPEEEDNEAVLTPKKET